MKNKERILNLIKRYPLLTALFFILLIAFILKTLNIGRLCFATLIVPFLCLNFGDILLLLLIFFGPLILIPLFLVLLMIKIYKSFIKN